MRLRLLQGLCVVRELVVLRLAIVGRVQLERLSRPPRTPLDGVVARLVEAEVIRKLAAHNQLLDERRVGGVVALGLALRLKRAPRPRDLPEPEPGGDVRDDPLLARVVPLGIVLRETLLDEEIEVLHPGRAPRIRPLYLRHRLVARDPRTHLVPPDRLHFTSPRVGVGRDGRETLEEGREQARDLRTQRPRPHLLFVGGVPRGDHVRRVHLVEMDVLERVSHRVARRPLFAERGEVADHEARAVLGCEARERV
mmetsp:Transcript_56683/g.135357  ORF Transcript_56683/g.135357 Transcript_56683/m.135357 type:complete len:253 (+) Transcript_56683:503-1261(+)